MMERSEEQKQTIAPDYPEVSQQTLLLAKYLVETEYQDLPSHVIEGMKALTLDWLGSALAGKEFYPSDLFRQYAAMMGPAHGPSTIFNSKEISSNELKEGSSPYFAALVNGACGHLLEQDDLHNSSVFHPATVVFPALLAASEDLNASGEAFLLAATMGYEAGIRIGEFLGRSHYRVFHTTSTVGSISAAIAVGKLMNFNLEEMLNLIGNAATQSAGIWAFLEDAADSKQLHTAKANANGLLAAYLTKMGLKGAKNSLEGVQGLAAGMSEESNPSALSDRLGVRWAAIETSFKYHASCRHTHPAGDALLQLLNDEGLSYHDIVKVEAFVHQAAIDVLGAVIEPQSIHQAKFSMGSVLGLLAVHGRAGLFEFDQYSLTDRDVIAFRQKVSMVLDPEIDAAYPKEWRGRVEVETKEGRRYQSMLRYPKGDPENPLTQLELEEKFQRLLHFSGDQYLLRQSKALMAMVWNLEELETMRRLTELIDPCEE